MKLLFITARFPYPPHKGDQAIPYYRLKFLSQHHEITLITLYETETELKYLDNISSYCKKIIPIKKSKWQSLFQVAMGGLFSRLPLQVLYYRSRKLTKAIEALCAEEGETFDFIHVYMLRIVESVLKAPLPRVPKILELIDSMQLNFERRAQEEGFPAKLVFNLELKRLKTYENRQVKQFDRCIVVSQKDRDYIGSNNIGTIPLGIDGEQFYPRKELVPFVWPEKVLAFTGNMGYFPNRNAILWFLKECWPLVKKEVAEAQLIIAGRGPGNQINAFDDGESVRVLGFVESMVKTLHVARVAIAPMQSGSGMQFKILEAMACGLPVVTTTLGLGSIGAQHQKEVWVADSPEDFARGCIALLKDDDVAENMGKSGMNMAHDQFSWQNNIAKLEQLYRKLKENQSQ